jgi:hypothetical protein
MFFVLLIDALTLYNYRMYMSNILLLISYLLFIILQMLF